MKKDLLQYKIEKMDEISRKSHTGRCNPFPLRLRGIDRGEKERGLQQHPLVLNPSTPGPLGTLLL